MLSSDVRPLPHDEGYDDRGFLQLSARRIGPYLRFIRRTRLPIPPWGQTLPANRDFRRRPVPILGVQLFIKKLTRIGGIAYSPESPGQIFKLDEDSVVQYLEELAGLTNGALRYDETAGLKQVYRDGGIDEIELLRNYYR